MLDMSRIELMIFDLDGTLIDSRLDIHNALNHALEKVGEQPLDIDVMLEHFARGSANLMADLLGPDVSRQQTAFTHYRQHYQDNMYTQTKLFDQVTDLLDCLAGQEIAMALVSNKHEQPCRQLLDFFKLNHHFPVVLGADSLPTKKPSPEPLLHAAQQLGIDPSKAVMIGDSPVDIMAGQKAGCQTVGILQGFTPKNQMLHLEATLIIDHVSELLTHFTNHLSTS